jgi:hypothetical protein
MRHARPQARYSVNEADRSVASWLTRPVQPGHATRGLQCVSYLPAMRVLSTSDVVVHAQYADAGSGVNLTRLLCRGRPLCRTTKADYTAEVFEIAV